MLLSRRFGDRRKHFGTNTAQQSTGISQLHMRLEMKALVALYVLALLCSSAKAYSSGAPDAACDSMTPNHGATGQISEIPYQVSFSEPSVEGGARVKITLSNSRADNFKGFLVKAVDSANETQTLGTFDVSGSGPDVKILSCTPGINNAVTHTSNVDKTEVAFDWIAPSDFNGSVRFLYTVVQVKTTFWVKGKSNDLAVSASTGTSTPQLSTTKVPSNTTDIYANCGVTKGCFGDSEGCVSSKSCGMVATYVLGTDSKVYFEMQAKENIENMYIALGLSDDELMGQDSIIECFKSNTGNQEHRVYMSYNKNGHDATTRLENPTAGLSDESASSIDGYYRCNFKRDVVTDVMGNTYNLLKTDYYLMLAWGGVNSQDAIQQHSTIPKVSSQKINVTEISVAGLASNPSIKIHGCLMVTAWICTVSIAIFLARYYKDMWPEVKHCGQKVWFAWHRGLNMLTVVFTLAAFIVIFVYIDGFTAREVWEKNPHAILGCITVGLMFIQPIMAFFRPHPGTPRRPIFNWAHYIVGMVSYILAIITIFFAVTLSKAELPDFFWWVLISFVGFDVIMFIVMEVSICMDSRQPARNQIAMKDYATNGHSYGISDISPEPQGARFKEVMFVLYLVGVTCFTAALIVIIAMSPF